MKSTLRVVYSADDHYASYLGISMFSLFEHHTDGDSIQVFVLDCGITPGNRDKLQSIADRFHRQLQFIPLSDALHQLPLNQGAHQISVASYARLFIAELLPEECDKALYLDCDTIVMDSLNDLWETELGNELIGGCQDTVDQYYHQVISLDNNVKYINAGILLINLRLWRKENMLQRFGEVITRFHGTVPHHDQGIINSSCGARRIILAIRYNVNSNLYSFSAETIRRMYFLQEYYTQAEVDLALRNPAIIHFTKGLVGRPWEAGSSHPEKDAFWSVVRKSPWADLPMLPDSREPIVKIFTFFYRMLPTPIFETLYRLLIRVFHRRW